MSDWIEKIFKNDEVNPSFPSEKITAGGETKKCKIISITEQNTFLFEINEVKGNINKII